MIFVVISYLTIGGNIMILKEKQQFDAEKLSVKCCDTRKDLGGKAAADVAECILNLSEKNDNINIIFAAAPSQNEFLEELAKNADIPWNKINAYHMDEYIGLSLDAPQGFGNFLKERLFGRVPLKSVSYLAPGSVDISLEIKRYSDLLEQNPVDIVCMGIGENCHIAFNDPHVALFDDPELVKTVELDNACKAQQVNDGCFLSIEEVPNKAITLTIPALMNAKYVFCMVPGKTKAWAVNKTINSDISEKFPSTILKQHNDAILYIDKESASESVG